MTKEEAKAIVKKNQAEIRHAEIMMEMYENGVRERKEHIVKMEEFINKKDDWRNRGISKDECVLLMNKVMLMQEMHAFAHVKNEGWVADWEDLSEEKFGILYSTYEGLEVNCSMGCNYFIFGIAVKSKEIAEEMLAEFGERVVEIYNKQY